MLATAAAVLFAIAASPGMARAEDLVLRGVTDMTVEGGTYEHLVIDGSSNVTVRGATFATPDGAVVEIDGSDHITLENLDIDGQTDACTGMNIGSSSYVIVRGSRLHDIADDGVQADGDHIEFRNNVIAHLYGVGTDSGGTCFNGHSDAFEVHDVDDSIFDGNLVYDVRSTSAFFMGNWDATTCDRLVLTNNVFYTPESGFVVYFHYAHGMVVVGNTFWQGRYGGVAIGADVTGLDLYGNILHSINYEHSGVAFDAAEHREDYNFLADDGQGLPSAAAHDIVADDPGFAGAGAIGAPAERDVAAEDFALEAGSVCIDSGWSGAGATGSDFFGLARLDIAEVTDRGGGGGPTFYDVGAMEYGATGPAPDAGIPGTDGGGVAGDGGSSTPPGDGGIAARDGAAPGGGSTDDGGCSCRAGGFARPGTGSVIMSIVVGLALRLRRRRRPF